VLVDFANSKTLYSAPLARVRRTAKRGTKRPLTAISRSLCLKETTVGRDDCQPSADAQKRDDPENSAGIYTVAAGAQGF